LLNAVERERERILDDDWLVSSACDGHTRARDFKLTLLCLSCQRVCRATRCERVDCNGIWTNLNGVSRSVQFSRRDRRKWIAIKRFLRVPRRPVWHPPWTSPRADFNGVVYTFTRCCQVLPGERVRASASPSRLSSLPRGGRPWVVGKNSLVRTFYCWHCGDTACAFYARPFAASSNASRRWVRSESENWTRSITFRLSLRSAVVYLIYNQKRTGTTETTIDLDRCGSLPSLIPVDSLSDVSSRVEERRAWEEAREKEEGQITRSEPVFKEKHEEVGSVNERPFEQDTFEDAIFING